jgi:CubicO group peptidase (beta-lactamase class C family)
MADLHDAIAAEAERTAFSGVVRVDRGEETLVAQAFGLADRGREVPNTVGTRFALASGAKGFTALVVMSLVEDGILALDTTAYSVLGDDLPLIDGAVTVEHLLAHRSGIGDYLDEDTMTDVKAYVMPVPVHTLASTEDYLSMLDGRPQVSAPGERFAYNNGGFVVLALIAERASGEPFHRLVAERVCEPAGLRDTGYLRSDELPGDAALGYLWADRPRTNDSTSRCTGQATAGSTRRPPISRGSGKPSSPARSCRSMPSPRWCAHGAIGRRRNAGTGSGSTCTRRPMSYGSRATTRGSRSRVRTSPIAGSRPR